MPLTAKVRVETGNTRHIVRGVLIPPPAFVRIEQLGEGSFYLLRYNEAGEELADTCHESVVAAKSQAKFEFEIDDEDWAPTDD